MNGEGAGNVVAFDSGNLFQVVFELAFEKKGTHYNTLWN